MVQSINLPDGSIGDFPDEMSEDEIAGVLGQQFPEGSGPPPDGGQQGGGEGGSVASERRNADPYFGLPTEMNGVTLDRKTRDMMMSARDDNDPKSKRMMTARIAGRIAAQSGDQSENFIDNVLAGKSGAGLRGFANGLFGAGDIAAGVGSYAQDVFDMQDSELTFGDHLEAQREFRRALNEEHGVIGLGAEVVGAVLSGGGLLKLGAKAGAKIGGVTGRALQGAGTFERGNKTANIAKASATGAAAGGVTGLNMEGDATVGAGIGAVAGPLGLGASRAIERFAPAIVANGKRVVGATLSEVDELMSGPAGRSLRIMAKKLKVSDRDIGQRWKDYEKLTGKPPTIADLANDEAAAEMSVIFGRSPPGAAEANSQAKKFVASRADEFSDSVVEGGDTLTATAQKEVRKKADTANFGLVNKDDFTFTEAEFREIIDDPIIQSITPPATRRNIANVLDQTEEGADVILKGADVNNLRRAMRKKANAGDGINAEFHEFADELEIIARTQNKKFGDAIDKSHLAAEVKDGIPEGRAAVRGKTSEVAAQADIAEGVTDDVGKVIRDSRTRGRELGARQELGDQAGNTIGSGARLAADLAEGTGMSERLRTILPSEEVDALVAKAQQHVRSVGNAERVAPGVVKEADLSEEVISAVIGAGAAATGKTGVGHVSNVGLNVYHSMMARLMPSRKPKVVTQMAKDLFDPEKVGQVIKAMERSGVPRDQILESIIQATPVASGIAAQPST
tara:strand:- start:5331 stop:7544 length:2214 start_codon:yes stop_codon:yes gene_type:complete